MEETPSIENDWNGLPDGWMREDVPVKGEVT